MQKIPRGTPLTRELLIERFGEDFESRAAAAYEAADNPVDRAEILYDKALCTVMIRDTAQCAELTRRKYTQALGDLREAVRLAREAGDAALALDALRMCVALHRSEIETSVFEGWERFLGPPATEGFHDCANASAYATLLVESPLGMTPDTREALAMFQAAAAHVEMARAMHALVSLPFLRDTPEGLASIIRTLDALERNSRALAYARELLTGHSAPFVLKYVDSCELAIRMVRAAIGEFTSIG